MPSRPPALLAALAMAVVLVGASGAAASPQPTPVCGFCPGIAGGPVPAEAVGETTIDVTFHEDGSADWRVAMQITNESVAEDLRDTPPDVSVPEGDRHPVTDLAGDPSVTVTDDDELVVTFTDAAAARGSVAGTMVSTAFDTRDAGYWYILNADRLTVQAPDGYVVGNQPGTASVEGDSATWRSGEDRAYIHRGLLVFTPADASAADARTSLATADALAPYVLDNLPFVVIPTGLFGALLAVGALVAGRLRGLEPSRTLARAAAALWVGAAVVVLSLLSPANTGFPHLFGESPLLWLTVVAVPGLGISLARRAPRRVAGWFGGLLLVFALGLSIQADLTTWMHGLALLAYSFWAVGLGLAAIPLVAAGTIIGRWQQGDPAGQ